MASLDYGEELYGLVKNKFSPRQYYLREKVGTIDKDGKKS